MFSKKMRNSLFGGIALSLAGLIAGQANASNFVVITSSFCQGVYVPSVLEWARTNGVKKYENIFYLKDNGDVVRVAGTNEFRDTQSLLVASHGRCGNTTPMAHNQFVDYLKAAGLRADRLEEVVSASCFAAQSTQRDDSLLRVFQSNFPALKKLRGATGPATLSSIGTERLADARLVNNPALYARTVFAGAPEFQGLLDSVNNAWNDAGPLAPQARCNLFVGAANIDSVATAEMYLNRFSSVFRDVFLNDENWLGRLYSYALPTVPMLTCGADIVSDHKKSEFRNCP